MQLHVIEQGDLIAVISYLCVAFALCGFAGAFCWTLLRDVVGAIQADIRASVWFNNFRAKQHFDWGRADWLPESARQLHLAKAAKYASKAESISRRRAEWRERRGPVTARAVVLPTLLAAAAVALVLLTYRYAMANCLFQTSMGCVP